MSFVAAMLGSRSDMNHQMDDEIVAQDAAPTGTGAQRVRKIVEEVCKAAGASVAIEERRDASDKSRTTPAHQIQVTYNGERPMQYRQWFKLVDTIDEALEPSGLIDWESSEL